jgi:hypothetical protein
MALALRVRGGTAPSPDDDDDEEEESDLRHWNSARKERIKEGRRVSGLPAVRVGG